MTVCQTGVAWSAAPVAIMAMVTAPNRLLAQNQGAPSTSMQEHQMMQEHMVSPDLMIPSMSPTNDRKLFASKGCVVCHSVNDIGGTDAAPLDTSTMGGMIDPFDFVASMWSGAESMIELQKEELGGQVEFKGRELADIIAFARHAEQQEKLSEADIPPEVKAAMTRMEQGNSEEGRGGMKGMDKMKPDPSNSGN